MNKIDEICAAAADLSLMSWIVLRGNVCELYHSPDETEPDQSWTLTDAERDEMVNREIADDVEDAAP